MCLGLTTRTKMSHWWCVDGHLCEVSSRYSGFFFLPFVWPFPMPKNIYFSQFWKKIPNKRKTEHVNGPVNLYRHGLSLKKNRFGVHDFPLWTKTPINSQFQRHALCSQNRGKKHWDTTSTSLKTCLIKNLNLSWTDKQAYKPHNRARI